MKTNKENKDKLVDALRYARDCVLDIWIRIEFGELKTNEKILEEIGRTHDFLTDAVVDVESNLKKEVK